MHPYPFPVHYTTLQGQINIAYVDEGSGPTTLIFIHGLGSYLRAWDRNIAELSVHYRCIAIDLPNYGRSQRGTYPFGISFFAKIVHDFVAALELKHVWLCGHSMGGQIAMKTVLDYPHLAKGMILVAPAGIEQFSEFEKQWMYTMNMPMMYKSFSAEQIMRNIAMNFYRLPLEASEMVEDRLNMMKDPIYYDSYCKMVSRSAQSMLKEIVRDQLHKIRLPVLFFFGEEDKLIPNPFLHHGWKTRDIGKMAIGLIHESKLVMVPLAGHFVQYEKAGIFNDAVTTFIEELKKEPVI